MYAWISICIFIATNSEEKGITEEVYYIINSIISCK